MLQAAYQAIEGRVRNLVLLEGPERTVRALKAEQQETVRKHYDAALRRASVADELADDRSAVAALVLYREAALLLIAALAVSRDSNIDVTDLSPPRMWAILGDLAQAGQIPSLPESVDEARRILLSESILSFDEHPADDLLGMRATVESSVKWIQSLIEPRTLPEIRRSRVMRLGVIGVVVVALLGWGASRFTKPTNIALHKPVTISGRHPQSLAPADNSGLVNGEIEPNYGVHTTTGGGWVMIDLQGSYAISTIKVYNRGDGWFDDGLPFTLEFSDDGAKFTEVERRTEPFTSASPWISDGGGRRTRFIRIRSNGYVALAEVEVIGRP
jgi:hypothetical protein